MVIKAILADIDGCIMERFASLLPFVELQSYCQSVRNYEGAPLAFCTGRSAEADMSLPRRAEREWLKFSSTITFSEDIFGPRDNVSRPLCLSGFFSGRGIELY